jgi:hypothetical protein
MLLRFAAVLAVVLIAVPAWATVSEDTLQIKLPNGSLYSVMADETVTAVATAAADATRGLNGCVRDKFGCRGSCRLVAVYVGYRQTTQTDGACTDVPVRRPVLWWVFSDSQVIKTDLGNLPTGAQTWEAVIDVAAADISPDGAYIIGSAERYGKTGAAGRFGLAWRVPACPTDWEKYAVTAPTVLADNPLPASATNPTGDVVRTATSPTRYLYMTDGLGEAFNITGTAATGYTVIGKPATGNLFGANCQPPLPLSQSATVVVGAPAAP